MGYGEFGRESGGSDVKRGAIVLAGGRNTRMGTEKWLLSIGGVTVLERVVNELGPRVDDVAVVLPFEADETAAARVTALLAGRGVRLLRDAEPDGGPLVGIAAGLAAIEGETALVSASDMPFVRWAVAEALFDACERSGADAAVPLRNGRLHPLFAVYRKTTLPTLRTYRNDGGRKVLGWIERLETAYVGDETLSSLDPDETAFFNMNAKPDYEEALRRIRSQE